MLCGDGTLKPLRISLGEHQDLVLLPLLFILVMRSITRGLPTESPYTLPYEGDVMIASRNKTELQQLVQN